MSQSAFTLPGTDRLVPMAPRIIVPTDLATNVTWLQSRLADDLLDLLADAVEVVAVVIEASGQVEPLG